MSESKIKNLIHKEVSYKKASKIVSIMDAQWFNCAYDEFIAIDIETTGLCKTREHILEVAAIRYRKCEEVDKFVTLINPMVKIPYYVSQIHGITNETVKNSPTIDVVIPQLLEFMGNSIIVAHNAHFDIGFIEVWARRLGYNPIWNYIDTISAARKVIPGLSNYKQQTVLNAIGYVQKTYHRAEDDVRGCVEIINHVFDRMKSKLTDTYVFTELLDEENKGIIIAHNLELLHNFTLVNGQWKRTGLWSDYMFADIFPESPKNKEDFRDLDNDEAKKLLGEHFYTLP
jgi:DNA polymerase III epsilon subunit family exonuclease